MRSMYDESGLSASAESHLSAIDDLAAS